MHEKVIVHIDIDCFYAQVEEILDSNLQDKAIGIQQKTCLVTANYRAREYGIKKLMYVPEAKKLCPDLVLINGEDLTKYKKMSEQIFSVLQKFTLNVEKLGLDENFLDVSEIVDSQISNLTNVEVGPDTFTLNINEEEPSEICDCGCYQRLIYGTKIANQIREALSTQLKITSCAGIAHNKLLAKLVGTQNKPNKQTIIFPHQSKAFLASLGSVRSLCGIGSKTAEILETLGIKTITDLQNTNIKMLVKKFDEKAAQRMMEIAIGIDKADVKITGKQKTISIEDSTYSNPLKSVIEVETKLSVLLSRLVDIIIGQKRIPMTLRVTLRKTTNITDLLQRESRQKDISTSWFKTMDPALIINYLYPIATLLSKQILLVDIELGRPIKITLVGVAFTKFCDEESSPRQSNTLMNFFKPVTSSDHQHKPDKIKEHKDTNLKKSDLCNYLTKLHDRDKRKNEEKDVQEPPSKKIKQECADKLFSEKVLPISISEIPKDMDIKAFNCLPISEKKRIIKEIKNAIKFSESFSSVKYPRKIEQNLKKNKMDAFVYRY